MSDLSFLTAMLCSVTGMFALCLSAQRHWRKLRPSSPPPSRGRRRGLQALGWLALTLAAALLAVGLGPGTGLTAWFGVQTLAALCVVFTLTYGAPKPRQRRTFRPEPTPRRT
ncbi:MAG: DUF3325 domain-containing protein [Ectothiorhodospiraceae bacterium]|nr:DUF3325 domain-containing protein [Ectothiorhodospiraceae bacterium]